MFAKLGEHSPVHPVNMHSHECNPLAVVCRRHHQLTPSFPRNCIVAELMCSCKIGWKQNGQCSVIGTHSLVECRMTFVKINRTNHCVIVFDTKTEKQNSCGLHKKLCYTLCVRWLCYRVKSMARNIFYSLHDTHSHTHDCLCDGRRCGALEGFPLFGAL